MTTTTDPTTLLVCPFCGGQKQYRSRSCRPCRDAARAQPVEARLFQRTTKGDGCWEWQGGRDNSGYGSIWDGRAMERTHRVSWIIANGPIPHGLWVLHHCDNRVCVRPDHLYLGTVHENNDDRTRRGRNVNRIGEQHGKARLSDDRVRSIRRLIARGVKQRDIAASLGVSESAVSRVKLGHTWGHVR